VYFLFVQAGSLILTAPRRHPAVMTQGDKVFLSIAQALEHESLSGQAATRVVAATKVLLREAGLNAAVLLQQFSQDAQQTISSYFTD
jgi:importin-5